MAANLIPIVASLISAGGSIGGGLLGSRKAEQQVLDPYEKIKAREELLNIVNSGSFRDVIFGQGYDGPLGNYDMTAVEKAGQGKLLDLVNSGDPELLGLASNEIKNILNTDKFDPYSDKGVYSGFKENVNRDLENNLNAFKRSASFAGNLYSSNTINRSGDLYEQGQKQLSGKLAELYDTFVQRKINAIPTALNAAQVGENINLNRIGASQQYGALERLLKDQKAKEAYAEWQRARNEKLQPINALTSLSGASTDYGLKSIDVQSPYSQLLNLIAFQGGNLLGNLYSSRSTGGQYSNTGTQLRSDGTQANA